MAPNLAAREKYRAPSRAFIDMISAGSAGDDARSRFTAPCTSGNSAGGSVLPSGAQQTVHHPGQPGYHHGGTQDRDGLG